MIELTKGYDSELDTVLCDWCKGALGPAEPKILYGTGNSLLSVFHPQCDEARIKSHELL